MWAAASDSPITRMAGTTPATAPSKRSWAPPRRAASNISSPCWESSCLLAVTTWRPDSSERSTWSRAGSSPPISSTIRSLRSRMSSNSPRLRVRMPDSSARRPVSASTASARSSSSVANAAPTVPWPRSPTRNGSGIPSGEVVEGLAPYDHARVAVAAEHHRRPRKRVVVVGHRVTVGPGGGDHQHVAGPRVVQRDVAHEDVARLTVHPRDRELLSPPKAVGDLGLVARPVEHGTQVVGHPAVHGDIGANAGYALDRPHRIDGHPRVSHERAPGLA